MINPVSRNTRTADAKKPGERSTPGDWLALRARAIAAASHDATGLWLTHLAHQSQRFFAVPAQQDAVRPAADEPARGDAPFP